MLSLPRTYNPKEYEDDVYRRWEDSHIFEPTGQGEPFYIPLPPPNATGTLHLGHAIMLALQDCFARFARMQGKDVLWLPGTDHAAIATENVVIRKLQDERGMVDPRKELGREGVLSEIQDFVTSSQDTIRDQVRKMGASVDWTRERYTMEPTLNRMVNEVFVKMYKAGVIYRGHRIVNWDPNLQTTVSDDEVEHKEETTKFYTLQYGPFQISTARPETKFGDKYVVVHPDDTRYADWTDGQKFEVEWINGKITATLIKDAAVDPNFGTGAMTITPWHDLIDFEIAERHGLDKQQIIDKDGLLLPIADEFAGMNIVVARPKIVEKLKVKGLLVKTEDYVHNISLNSRGKGIIEPQIMEQWFVDVNKPSVDWEGKKLSLKQVMRSVVESDQIDIVPDKFRKVYYHWIDNLRDWCISRQIWWGHRIPVWYNGDQTHVGANPPDDQAEWHQDPDTLDTWFSSGIWTFSTLVDPISAANPDLSLEDILKNSADFQRYHPAAVLETGYDILFFWVARMILMTTFTTGQIPFKKVYLHGMVRDRKGKKMSKSDPSTAIDPLEIIPEFGADALRLSMLIGQAPGNDSRLYKEKIAGYRNFCNKLWNVGRYIASVANDGDFEADYKINSPADSWIIDKLNKTTAEVSNNLSAFNPSQAGQSVYHFLWDNLADWYIEVNKIQPNIPLLINVFKDVLRLAHPFAPFVTETLWGYFDKSGQMLAATGWPDPSNEFDAQQVATFDGIINIVVELRTIQSELQIEDNTLYYQTSTFLDENADLITKLSNIRGVQKVRDGRGLHLANTDVDCWLDVSTVEIKNHLLKQIKTRDEFLVQLDKLNKRLSSEQYLKSAPPELVAESRAQKTEIEAKLTKLAKLIDNIEQTSI